MDIKIKALVANKIIEVSAVDFKMKMVQGTKQRDRWYPYRELLMNTGFKDIDGEELFEGDIVEGYTISGNIDYFVVFWHKERFGFFIRHNRKDWIDPLVGGVVWRKKKIGNIYIDDVPTKTIKAD